MTANIGDTFKPGDTCEASGIYTVTHDAVHSTPHDVTVVYGEPFPPCNHCGRHPRFEARVLATHISNHEHLKK